MSRFFPTALAIIAAAVTFSTGLRASNLSDSASLRFDQTEKELDKIEQKEGAQFAVGEIAVARKWIEDGRALIESGKTQKAAKLAERLPFQVDLIRTLIATGVAAAKATKEEKNVFELEKKLEILKARRNRLLLEIHGHKVTGAFPPKKEATP